MQTPRVSAAVLNQLQFTRSSESGRRQQGISLQSLGLSHCYITRVCVFGGWGVGGGWGGGAFVCVCVFVCMCVVCVCARVCVCVCVCV
jgi:hypothetical protein